MDDIEFVELPAGAYTGNALARRRRLKEFAARLRRRPGQWARYPFPTTPAGARAVASRINRGKTALFGTRFEAASTFGQVYVRFVGRPGE